MTPESKADLQSILDLHAAIQGEATEDRRRYCGICRCEWAAIAYPCKTVRLVQGILERETT